LAREERATLKERATRAIQAITGEIAGAQLVLWMDNHYLQRFGTDPGDGDRSTNVTAMAVLVVDRLVTGPRATRSVHWPGFPGQLELKGLVSNLGEQLDGLASELPALMRSVDQTGSLNLGRAEVRVPLDVRRGPRPSLRWSPWDLNALQVGSTNDLVLLLLDAVDLQRVSGHPLPLLIDENIHYRVARLLYASPYRGWNLGKVLHNVPLLYGVWHAYEHTVTVMYRTFFAVLGILDCTGQPKAREPVSSKRRVLHMEKMFAVLYLLRRQLLPKVKALLRTREATGPRADEASSSRDPVPNPPGEGAGSTAAGRARLVALRDLLEFYAPAALRLGFLVRECTWSGGPQGSVRGDTALQILRDCLLLQVHLQQDWLAQQEYTRTIAVALLMWQPWMSALPGCCFVEESGEALLSRYTAACRKATYLSGYEAPGGCS